MADVRKADSRLLEAEVHSPMGKPCLVLHSREAFFLGGRDRLAVGDERSSGIGEAGEAEDVHQRPGRRASRASSTLKLDGFVRMLRPTPGRWRYSALAIGVDRGSGAVAGRRPQIPKLRLLSCETHTSPNPSSRYHSSTSAGE